MEIGCAMTKTNDIFKRQAERNRLASLEAEKSRKTIKPVDYEALEKADRDKALDEFEKE